MIETKVVGVCGSRSIDDRDFVWDKLDGITSKFLKVEVCHGACPDKQSPDWFADAWALKYGYKLMRFWPDWDKYGRRAGPIRNREMAEYLASKSGFLIAFWDGESRGTANMIEEFLKLCPEKKLRTVRT